MNFMLYLCPKNIKRRSMNRLGIILTMLMAICHIDIVFAQNANLTTKLYSRDNNLIHSFGAKDIKAIRHSVDAEGNNIASVDLRYGATLSFNGNSLGSIQHEQVDLTGYNPGDIYKIELHQTYPPVLFLNTFFDPEANEGALYKMGSLAYGVFQISHPTAVIEVYNISYVSTDIDGSKILLTERVCYPHDPIRTPDICINKVYLYNHFTQTWEGDAPTAGGTFHVNCGIVFRDYMVIMPDGLGFGSTRNRAQVFLDADNVARWHLDGLRAGLQLAKEVEAPLAEGYGIINAGASQGGAAAMAVQRYYDTMLTDEERAQMPITETRVFAGPYNPSETVDKHAKDDVLAFPQLEPLLIQGCMLSHPDDFTDEAGKPYDIKDYLSELCLNYRCPQYENMTFLESLESKKLDGTASATLCYIMCDMVPTFRKIIAPDLFTPSGELDYSCRKMQVLSKVLERSNLVGGWTPRNKVTLCHCADDNIVPVASSDAIYDYWTKQGCNKISYDRIESSGYDHITSSWIWISSELTGLSMNAVIAIMEAMNNTEQ